LADISKDTEVIGPGATRGVRGGTDLPLYCRAQEGGCAAVASAHVRSVTVDCIQ